ncbi:MAG: hypothetical protein KatS3mg118_3224 [Paracoccaceae bacterium]|nr:MAG: hypothetical protein KatS3mg118_3224 [Paracoccaceae bacterium]
MLDQMRTTAVVVIGAAIAAVMLGLAALIAISLLIGTAALAFAARGVLKARIERVLRERAAMGGGQPGAGEVIEGEWTVVDVRAGQAARSA